MKSSQRSNLPFSSFTSRLPSASGKLALFIGLIASTSAPTAPRIAHAESPTAKHGSAHTPSAPSTSHWKGTGYTTTIRKHDRNRFTVELDERVDAKRERDIRGKVTLEGGRVITFWQHMTPTPGGGFRLTSSNGKGGGQCFDNHMCQSYAEQKDGHGFATTIALDGDAKMRILVTELEHGKAVRFVAQQLHRTP